MDVTHSRIYQKCVSREGRGVGGRGGAKVVVWRGDKRGKDKKAVRENKRAFFANIMKRPRCHAMYINETEKELMRWLYTIYRSIKLKHNSNRNILSSYEN